MMMLHGAAAIYGLVVTVAQHVDEPVVRHRLQDPVSGRERHGVTAIVQDAMQLLGAHEIVEFIERGAHGAPLAGHSLFRPPAGGLRRVARTC